MPTDPARRVIAVPPIGLATHEWTPRPPSIHSRAAVRRQTGTYQSAIVPPIAQCPFDIGGEDAADVEDATLALTTFDSYAVRTLGPGNPAIGPMSAILLRTESASSSQIEQLTTSARQLALAELGEGEKANAATVVGNVRATEAALRLSERLDVASILAMHHELLLHQVGLEHEAGRFRTELVWIGGEDAGPRGAEFIAPQHDLVPGAVSDVVSFMQRADLPVLLQVAVAHAHFETIHPFVDGNGRTGRALAQALLRNKAVSPHTTAPLSAGLLTNTAGYFDALSAYRSGDAGPIIRRFAHAARFAATSGRRLVDDLATHLDDARARMAGVRSQSSAWRVVPLLIGQPVVNAAFVRQALDLSTMTTLRAIDTLVARGVIVERTGRARNRVWQHSGILDALDDFAGGIRRSAGWVPRRSATTHSATTHNGDAGSVPRGCGPSRKSGNVP